MNNLIFSDRLLIFVSTIALIITMGFVAMMFQDLNDLRINNLEIIVIKLSKINLGV
jgi:hypothetical protein